MTTVPPLPEGWLSLGFLPRKEPDEMTEQEALIELRDRICLVQTPNAEYTVQVLWRRDYAGQIRPRPGRFVCKVVQNKNWSKPKEEWRFPRTSQMREWFLQRVAAVMRGFAR